MKFLRTFSSPFTTFYVVFAYAVAFALWWAYLLYDKNEAAYNEMVELNTIRYQLENKPDFHTTAQYIKMNAKYNRQRFMIVAEGSVFVVMLCVGLMLVLRVFAREVALAEQQKNFLLSITHELKSPLSSIKAALQTFSNPNLSGDKKEKLIHNSIADSDRLEALVNNILFAAKIERDEHGLGFEEINLSEMIEALAARFSHNKKAIAIHVKTEENIYMNTDPVGFSSIFINLLENAIKYSPENTRIDISLKEANGLLMLEIKDEGIGIPETERSKVFHKFYRIGSEETRRTKGTGLGLYIVKRFVQIYNGSITLHANEPRGTVFLLSFPR
jgi:signal transduction histidine kinase